MQNVRVSSPAPDVSLVVTNPINGLTHTHVGRLDCGIEAIDMPILFKDVLSFVYGGSGAKRGLGNSIQRSYGTYVSFEMAGIMVDCVVGV